MFYVMNNDNFAPPSPAYFETIYQGFTDWSIPYDSLLAALDHAHEHQPSATGYRRKREHDDGR